jgi:hypothetical protein
MAGFVLAGASAGLADATIRGDVGHLQAVAAQAAGGTQPHTRRWAAYVHRLFDYLNHPHGPVNRTKAEGAALSLGCCQVRHVLGLC